MSPIFYLKSCNFYFSWLRSYCKSISLQDKKKKKNIQEFAKGGHKQHKGYESRTVNLANAISKLTKSLEVTYITCSNLYKLMS